MNNAIMHFDRGLTLVEVLMSLVLLTLIATTTLPLIQRATAILADASITMVDHDHSWAEFSQALGTILAAQPASLATLDEFGTAKLTWRTETGDHVINTRALTPFATGADHMWLECSCPCGFKLYRWRTVEPAPQTPSRKPSASGGVP